MQKLVVRPKAFGHIQVAWKLVMLLGGCGCIDVGPLVNEYLDGCAQAACVVLVVVVYGLIRLIAVTESFSVTSLRLFTERRFTVLQVVLSYRPATLHQATKIR